MVRVFHHYISGRKAALFFAESWAIAAVGLTGSLLAARLAASSAAHFHWRAQLPRFALVSMAFVVIFQFALYLFDLYDLKVASEDRVRGNRVLKAMGGGAVLLGALLSLEPGRLPSGAVLGAALGTCLGIIAIRAAQRVVVGQPSRVLIVGDGVKALAVAKAIDEGGEGTFQVVARVEPHRAGTEPKPVESLLETARRLAAQFVVMAVDEPRGAVWVEDLIRCRFEGRKVYDAAGFHERMLRRLPVAHLHPSEIAFSDEVRASRLGNAMKRGLDLIMASALLVLAGPLMLLVALAIKLDSPGPVFYRQERVGQHGRSYWLWKFRSMRADAEREGAVWARLNDDRVTRVGRFIRKARIDEIPQVINVLVGQMSFVGPRPERPVFVQQLKQQIPFYGLREMVKPGITGWAQIRYPYGASVEDARNKLELDLYYVKHRSLFLDVGIIFHTVRHVLFGRGAR